MDTIELLKNTECSYYNSIVDHKATGTVKLIEWISSYPAANKNIIERIRSLNSSCEMVAKILKRTLPAATISAVFDGDRKITPASKINSIIAIDVDKCDNPHIPDLTRLKDDALAIDGAFLASRSCRGEGIFVLVYIDLNKDHDRLFTALEKEFRERLNVIIDSSCSDITRPRFISYDEDIRIRSQVEMFSKNVDIS